MLSFKHATNSNPYRIPMVTESKEAKNMDVVEKTVNEAIRRLRSSSWTPSRNIAFEIFELSQCQEFVNAVETMGAYGH